MKTSETGMCDRRGRRPSARDPSLRDGRRRGRQPVGCTGPAYLSLEGSSMHRVVGDRTLALGGAITVAGLCRDLTGFATTRRDWLSRPLYHPTIELPDRRAAARH